MLEAVIASLIANGLTTLVSYGVQKAGEISKRRDSIREALEGDEDLVLTIQKVMTRIEQTSISSSSKLQDTMMQLFLEDPTTESIVRQIYSDSMHEDSQRKSEGQLREEFQFWFASYLKADMHEVERTATDLFDVILMGCRKALRLAVSQDILSAHESKSIARHRALLDEIRAIGRNIEFLKGNSTLDLDSIRGFEEKYRCQVGERSSHITVPHFDRATRIPIDRIFVSPSFISRTRREQVEPEKLSLDDFLTRLYRSVLLGDPGGGKSTLAQKICYDLCEDYQKRLVGGRLLTPVLIVLRDYSSKKKKDGSSIVQFMESEVTSKYQYSQASPPGAFEYLLHNGHVLIIFDGLDELLEPSHRREISSDIESFCSLFPSVPVLVTSRVVGYEQAPLDSERFETFHIAPFDNDQVSEYAKKWFGNDPDLLPDEKEQCIQTFLQESRIASDLRSNPLMLALMCNLYRGAGFIPQNRPELYRKCSEMLFERWDRSRGIQSWANISVSEPKFLLNHLAHWIYCDESLQSGVTEDQLIRESVKFLCPRRFETEEEAEKASQAFIEFCRGRAWVFTDAGTTPRGLALYKFTHKTFLEYFTAAHIVRNNNIPAKLWITLKPRIAERTWDMVAQLAFQMLHEQVEGAADELLNLLLKAAKQSKKTRWAYLSFGARCVQFIYPSPQTIRSLTRASVECTIRSVPSSQGNRRYEEKVETGELIGALVSAAPGCRTIVADSLESGIVDYVKNADNGLALRAIDLASTLSYAVGMHGVSSSFVRDVSYWETVKSKIFENVDERFEELARVDFTTFIHWFNQHDMPVEQLFAWYTPDHLFLRSEPRVLNVYLWSIAVAVIFHVSASPDAPLDQVSPSIGCLARISEILLSRSLPCFSYAAVRYYVISPWEFFSPIEFTKEDEEALVRIPISGEAIIGAWCLLAASAEVVEKPSELIGLMRRYRSPVMQAVSHVIEARILGSDPDEAIQGLRQFDPPENALESVKLWINRQLSFVYPPKPEEGEVYLGKRAKDSDTQ